MVSQSTTPVTVPALRSSHSAVLLYFLIGIGPMSHHRYSFPAHRTGVTIRDDEAPEFIISHYVGNMWLIKQTESLKYNYVMSVALR